MSLEAFHNEEVKNEIKSEVKPSNFSKQQKIQQEITTLNDKEKNKDEKEADELLNYTETNEDQNIDHFVYEKGTAKEGDILVNLTNGLQSKTPIIYVYDKETNTYSNGGRKMTLDQLQKKYYRHIITPQDNEANSKPNIEELKKIPNKILFETGNGKIFIGTHNNWETISNEEVNLFKERLKNYLKDEKKITLPEDFRLGNGYDATTDKKIFAVLDKEGKELITSEGKKIRLLQPPASHGENIAFK